MSLRTECAECGGPIDHKGVGRPRRFCSDACKHRHHNRRARRRQLPLRKETKKVCAHCKAEFVAKRRDRIYCYDKWCAQSAYQERRRKQRGPRMVLRFIQCDGCGQWFTGEHPKARWCSKQCANRHWGRVRARKRSGIQLADYTDRDVFERDGWVCQICMEPVDPALARTDERGATIDHVTPLSRGGEDSIDNVVTAHWSCNREKRNS